MTNGVEIMTHSVPYEDGWFFCYTCNREVQAGLIAILLPKEGLDVAVTVYAMCHRCGRAGLKAATTMSLDSI